MNRTRPDPETTTMIAITLGLWANQHIILAAFTGPNCFKLP